MTSRILLILIATLSLGLASCADNDADRGTFHTYLHDHGLE